MSNIKHPPIRYPKESTFPHGEVYHRMGDEGGFEYLGKNVVTSDASIFFARLIRDPSEPTSGAFALAVGTGDSGWNPSSVPIAEASQGSLYTEIDRVTFTSIEFIDEAGDTSAIPTNVLDFTATFSTTQAVGALVEMGIVCGAVDTTNPLTATPIPQVDWSDPTVDRTEYDTFLNIKNFNVVNKPSGQTYTLVWRVTL